MYQQAPYNFGYSGYQQTYYPTPQMWQPQPQTQQMPQKPSNFAQQQMNYYEKVNGFDEVKSYHMQGGAQMLFVDANAPYLYTKATDISGRAEIHAFELKEIPIEDIGQPKIDLSGYVTKEDFEKSQQEIISSIEGTENRIMEQIRAVSLKTEPTTKFYESQVDLPEREETIVKSPEIKRDNASKKQVKNMEVKNEQSIDKGDGEKQPNQ